MPCDGEDIDFDVVISEANFVGSCPRCSEPTTGSYDSDRGEEVNMKCVSCGFKQYLALQCNKLVLPLIYSG